MPNKNSMIKKAVSLYRRFTGHEARYIDEYKFPQHNVLVKIGVLEGVMYETVRDGKREKYMHRFAQKSRPILASSWDGSQLYVLGGSYDFTEDGIIDKDP